MSQFLAHQIPLALGTHIYLTLLAFQITQNIPFGITLFKLSPSPPPVILAQPLIKLLLINKNDDYIQHDHFLINEKINLDERI